MTSPRFALIPVLGHEIHVTEWGDTTLPPLVMWHGLARTGRDFDELAAALSDSFFVLCPDTIGRGFSSWSSTPAAEYSLDHYTAIAEALLDHYGIARTGWIGTSMGGLIGMRMASGPLAARLDYLIVNDIGPELPQAAIDRILAYADVKAVFATLAVAEARLRDVYAPFGPAADAFWRRMARSSVRRQGDGSFTTHYDPRITVQFTASPDELDGWERYDRIALPMHVICGAHSDVLPADVRARMLARGPKPGVTLYEECGHAPSLSRPEDAAAVRGIIAGLRAQG